MEDVEGRVRSRFVSRSSPGGAESSVGPASQSSADAVQRLAAPGFDARTLQLRRAVGNSAALQYFGEHGPAPESEDLHQLASEGLSGGGGELPHGEAIQAAFGGHDVGGISAHVGGAAAGAASAMGATAYATGDHVAFAAQPDLHTAAHEATHVVQQRAGVVQLKGGVGQVGDPYERHADQVADAVVAGRNAEPVLDSFLGGGSGVGTSSEAPVQRDTTMASLPEALGPAQSGDVASQGDGDGNAFSPNDVNQGSIGDCYFLASLVAIAHSSPALLEQAITANADGTYSVRMYRKEVTDFLFFSTTDFTEVTVQIFPTFPVAAAGTDTANPNASANPPHAHGGDVDASGNPELWVRLFEKAYALMMGSYGAIASGGFGANALEALTGQAYEEQVLNGDDTHQHIIDMMGDGAPVEVATNAQSWSSLSAENTTFAQNNSIVPGHSYAVLSADSSGVTLRNPWGSAARVAEPRLTWAQFDALFWQFSNRQ